MVVSAASQRCRVEIAFSNREPFWKFYMRAESTHHSMMVTNRLKGKGTPIAGPGSNPTRAPLGMALSSSTSRAYTKSCRCATTSGLISYMMVICPWRCKIVPVNEAVMVDSSMRMIDATKPSSHSNSSQIPSGPMIIQVEINPP